MTTDTQAFGIAFAIVWLGLGAYLVRLHLVATRLEARLASLASTRQR